MVVFSVLEAKLCSLGASAEQLKIAVEREAARSLRLAAAHDLSRPPLNAVLAWGMRKHVFVFMYKASYIFDQTGAVAHLAMHLWESASVRIPFSHDLPTCPVVLAIACATLAIKFETPQHVYSIALIPHCLGIAEEVFRPIVPGAWVIKLDHVFAVEKHLLQAEASVLVVPTAPLLLEALICRFNIVMGGEHLIDNKARVVMTLKRDLVMWCALRAPVGMTPSTSAIGIFAIVLVCLGYISAEALRPVQISEPMWTHAWQQFFADKLAVSPVMPEIVFEGMDFAVGDWSCTDGSSRWRTQEAAAAVLSLVGAEGAFS